MTNALCGIYSTVRRAMRDDSRLLVVEALNEAETVRPDVIIGDLIMLTMAPGRERSEAEHRDLLCPRGPAPGADHPDGVRLEHPRGVAGEIESVAWSRPIVQVESAPYGVANERIVDGRAGDEDPQGRGAR